MDVGEESLPHRLFIVIVQRDYLLSIESPTTARAVCSLRIPPGRSEYNFVSDGEAEDEQETNRVLEEIIRRKRSTALVHHVSS